MDRAPPPKARSPIAPLAAATVVASPPRKGGSVHPAALAVALVAAGAAIVLNSPLLDWLGLAPASAWHFVGFWAEAGAVAAVLGMAYRNPALAWAGAGTFFVMSLALSRWVWPGHLVSIALLGAVAAWHLRLRTLEPPRPGGWLPVVLA